MINLIRLAIFLVLSAGAIAVSLQAWRTKQEYGYYRFFGFETVVLLIVLNVDRWFQDPLSARQLASWLMLAAGTALAIHGAYLLRAVGNAQERGIEGTLKLVEVGIYRYIRHPLYGSLMLLAWAVFLKGIGVVSAALALLNTLSLIATSRAEERFNLERFGAAYAEYMERTKRFIPFLL